MERQTHRRLKDRQVVMGLFGTRQILYQKYKGQVTLSMIIILVIENLIKLKNHVCKKSLRTLLVHRKCPIETIC